jgi:hypothetical protein
MNPLDADLDAMVAELEAAEEPGSHRPAGPGAAPEVLATGIGFDLAAVTPDREVEVPIGLLEPHPRNAVLLPATSKAEDDALAADLDRQGQVHPVVVAGTGCASPPGTLLDGHRRRARLTAVGATTVRAILRTGLSAEDEERLIVGCALASQVHRKLDDAAKYRLEERSRELLRHQGLRKGARSTSVEFNGGSGEADALVAKLHGETPNSVRTRKKVFGSPVTTPALQGAVAAKRIAPSAAARIVREVEATLPEGSQPDPVVEDAKKVVDAKVAEAVAKPRAPRRKSAPPGTAGAAPAEERSDAAAPVDAKGDPPAEDDDRADDLKEEEAREGVQWSDARNFRPVRNAVATIATARLALAEHVPSLNSVRLGRILGALLESGTAAEEGTIDQLASKLVDEDGGAGMVLNALKKAPPEGTHARVDAIREKVTKHIAAGRPTDTRWGDRRSTEITFADFRDDNEDDD